MQPAVSFLHRRSPASIALAPRAILFRLHHLPDDSRTKLGRRLRKKAAISKENRIAKSTACFVSSGYFDPSCIPGHCQALFRTASGLCAFEHQNPVVTTEVAKRTGQPIAGCGEDVRHFALLRVTDLDHDPAFGFQKARRFSGYDPVGA